jgi:predicted aldo/keto reductase-like oxidoreductase
MSTLELSLGFVQSIPEIDKIVVGVNTSEQLHEIIDVASTYVNTKELSDLSISNPDFLNPSNWKI